MNSTPPILPPQDDLLDRARQGDQGAWQVLFDECYPKIVRVVRNRMNRPMRKIYDSTDIANEVMKSLAAKFHHFDFSSVSGLRAYLLHAAEQKVIDGSRRGHAKKRDLSRDQALVTSEGAVAWDLPDDSPTASQVAVASEEEELILGGQTGPHRTVLELKLQGLSNPEVARATGWHVRKIERFLEKLRGTLRL